MEQRLSMITLGVADVAAARAFYAKLGWTPANDGDIAFYQCGGMVFVLWDRAELAQDSGVPLSDGGVTTLAQLVDSPDTVDAVLAEARRAGAEIRRLGGKTVWGGYSGVFVDPDGHPWEVAHNPRWTVHGDGSTTLD